MQVESFRRDLGASLGWAVAATLAIVCLVVAAGPAVAQSRALDCNSNLVFELPTMGIVAGATIPVTLTVENGVSTDAANNPVAQEFKTIKFFPSCSTTVPCVPPAAPLPVTFVGPVSTNCVVDDPWTIVANPAGTEIEFQFTGGTGPDPNALTLPAAAMASGKTSCQLVFNVKLADPFAGPIDMEADIAGTCDPGGLDLNSSKEATAEVRVDPFCGDGNLDPGETCDPAGPMPPAGCRPMGAPDECTYCGDGIMQTGEACDDGNTVDDDMCSNTCNAVPTLGEYGLIALALLLGLGAWMATRRRTAAG